MMKITLGSAYQVHIKYVLTPLIWVLLFIRMGCFICLPRKCSLLCEIAYILMDLYTEDTFQNAYWEYSLCCRLTPSDFY